MREERVGKWDSIFLPGFSNQGQILLGCCGFGMGISGVKYTTVLAVLLGN